MEELLPDLPTLAPGLGVLGLLCWFLIRVMRESAQDRAAREKVIAELRKQQVEEIRELSARHDRAFAEIRQQQTEQIADLRGQLKVVQDEVAQLRVEVDQQRRMRWQAEDAAARYRRQLGLPPDGGGGG